MARQLGLLLTQHMQQYTYSALGALRWIQDLGKYRDTVHSLAGASAASVSPFAPACCCVPYLSSPPSPDFGLTDAPMDSLGFL